MKKFYRELCMIMYPEKFHLSPLGAYLRGKMREKKVMFCTRALGL
jgi:hypothetical protein